jgi:hypothetical protein
MLVRHLLSWRLHASHVLLSLQADLGHQISDLTSKVSKLEMCLSQREEQAAKAEDALKERVLCLDKQLQDATDALEQERCHAAELLGLKVQSDDPCATAQAALEVLQRMHAELRLVHAPNARLSEEDLAELKRELQSLQCGAQHLLLLMRQGQQCMPSCNIS